MKDEPVEDRFSSDSAAAGDVGRAEGVLMAVYGLGRLEARTVLRLRAELLHVDLARLPGDVVAHASALRPGAEFRHRASEVLDLVGAGSTST